jgi:hypothetical protein
MSTMLDVRDRRLSPALQARSPSRAGGSEGNRRLTASTAAVLLALLAAEGATLLAIRPLVSAHVFIGMLLVPPIALKVSTTGYRFLRYYTGGPEYRSAGPPHPLLRLLGPVVVLSTAALFGTGIALIALGPEHGRVLGLHKASFVVWFGAMGLHVLAHVLRLPRLVTADWKPAERLPGASLRAWIVVGTLVAGAVLAVATVHLAAPWHSFHSFDG